MVSGLLPVGGLLAPTQEASEEMLLTRLSPATWKPAYADPVLRLSPPLLLCSLNRLVKVICRQSPDVTLQRCHYTPWMY